ncbi:MAG: cyclophilin-like fold protein, partial [Thermodesulfovibrionales bacterium]
MSVKIKIATNDIVLDAELFSTATAKSIADALPIDVKPNEWGDEFYFEIPVKMPLDETATTKVS